MKTFKLFILFLVALTITLSKPNPARAQVIELVAASTLVILAIVGGDHIHDKTRINFSHTQLDQAMNFIENWCWDVDELAGFYTHTKLLNRLDVYYVGLERQTDAQTQEFVQRVAALKTQPRGEQAYYAALMEKIINDHMPFKKFYAGRARTLRENKCQLPQISQL